MKVLTPSQEIFDPDGALIGKTKVMSNRLLKFGDFFGNNGAVGVHSGGNVASGDQVTLY